MKNEDKIRNKDNTKHLNNIKNEDNTKNWNDIKNEYNVKNEDDMKNEVNIKNKDSFKKWWQHDSSLKCSARKGFTPRLEWKCPSPKQIFSPKKSLGHIKHYGSKEMFCLQKILILKSF